MGFLDFLKGKKKDPKQEHLEETVVVLPVSLDEAHSFVAPRRDEYPSPPTFGATPYSDAQNVELPRIPNQDELMTHWLLPPAAKPPEEWWQDRSASRITLGRQEHFQTRDLVEDQSKFSATLNPWLSTADSPRKTSHMSPSNYRFLRPFDQRWSRVLTGQHSSAASVARAMPVGGMEPVRNFRNTFRLEPTARDIENVDLSGARTAEATPAVYVSPASRSSRWGL